LSIRRTTINLGAFLAIGTGEKKSNGSSQFRLTHLLWDLNIGGVELPVAVGFQDAKNIADDLLLPVDQIKRLTSP